MKTSITRGPHYDSPVAANMRRLIEHSGLSVNAWAKAHGMHQSTLNRVVVGKSDITVGQLLHWAELLGCRAEELLRESFDPARLPLTLDETSGKLLQHFRAVDSPTDRQLLLALAERLAK